MLHRYCLLVAVLLAICGNQAGADSPYPLFTEPYRPGYHFSPPTNWMNEPNGTIYHNGEYHLFYQHNAFNNQWGNMSWGHAISTDLLHWEHQPVAIPGENGIMAFTGTTVFDANNTSGLGTSANPPLVAAYTGWDIVTKEQDQRLAFSLDSGRSWTKYAGNPVLDINSNEFRDPKVFWHDDTNQWIMLNSHGGQERVSFWQSPNLKDWTIASNFFDPGLPQSIDAWEVPDMFQLPVDGDPNNMKWVLSLTPSNGSPAGGNGQMYFVGDFDGTTFNNLNPNNVPFWMDYGRDMDGALTFENAPNDRRVMVGVMNSYGETVPTTPWRGSVSLPRELSLTQAADGYRILQKPIDEIVTLRGQGVTLGATMLTPGVDPLDNVNLSGDMLEIVATFEPGTASLFGFSVREGLGQQTFYGYDANTNEMFVNRTISGNTSFHPDAGGQHRAPLELDNGQITLRAFVDRGSLEVFGNNGEAVISNLIFADPSSQDVSLFSTGGNAHLVSLEAYPLSSTNTPGPAPGPGSNVIAHWNMTPVPQSAGGGFFPITIDQRTANGEGTLIGTTRPLYEPDENVDNLFASNGLPDQAYRTRNESAPASMFAYGKEGGQIAYDAAAISGETGSLYLPVDRYGDEAAFTDAFSIELFFRTDGNQSGAGLMQLLNQGEDDFRYGLIVNEGGAGNVRFALNDQAGTIPVLDINSVSGKNYADGQWHYVLATYDPHEGNFGAMELTLASEDGSVDTVQLLLNAAFQGLPSGSDGNLLIGRESFALNNDNGRTFLGLIDEVQLTRGLVSGVNRLGAALIIRQGDFDGDGTYTCADIDTLVAEIAANSGNLAYDLTGDEFLNEFDLSAWLVEAGAANSASGAPFLMGDANLDGSVDGQDFIVWNDNKFTSTSAWCSADFNADGVTDGQDFLIWNDHKFMSSDHQVAVPEPTGWLAWFAVVWAARSARCSRPT